MTFEGVDLNNRTDVDHGAPQKTHDDGAVLRQMLALKRVTAYPTIRSVVSRIVDGRRLELRGENQLMPDGPVRREPSTAEIHSAQHSYLLLHFGRCPGRTALPTTRPATPAASAPVPKRAAAGGA
jgi:hypothetical protein